MDDRNKVIVEMLHKEVGFLKDKCLAVDGWLFKFVSVGIIPFFAFVGYCLFEDKYRFAIIALPIISTVGILILFTISYHYLYAYYYEKYLQEKINTIIEPEYIKNIEFQNVFYRRRLSMIRLAYGLGIIFLVLMNIVSIPYINSIRMEYLGTHSNLPRLVLFFGNYYWHIVVMLLLVVLITCWAGYFTAINRAKRLTTG